MTPTMDCAEARLSLGVYVLGAIDPAERAQVDAHLTTCRECRDELAGLAGLPALLARVGKEEAIALAAADGPPASQDEEQAPPRELLATVLDLTAARRRRRGWRDVGIGVAAALIIGAGVFGGLRITAGPAQPATAGGSWETVTGQSHGMSATVKYDPVGWGTQLLAKVNGIPLGTTCQLWAVMPGNKWVMAGSWITDRSEGSVWYPGSAAVNGNDVQEFVVTVGKTGSVTVESS